MLAINPQRIHVTYCACGVTNAVAIDIAQKRLLDRMNLVHPAMQSVNAFLRNFSVSTGIGLRHEIFLDRRLLMPDGTALDYMLSYYM